MKLDMLFPALTVDELQDHWLGGRHYVAHGDVARLAGYMDVPHTLEEFLPQAAYHCTISAFNANAQGDLAPLHNLTCAQAVQLFHGGQTIQFSGAHRCAGLSDRAASLARELGIPGSSATARVIYSPPNAPDAYGWHFDTANVIAVQLAGSKVWQLAANDDLPFPHRSGHPSQPVRGPLNDLPGYSPPGYGPRSFDREALERSTSARLTAGSVLYNPGGQWHRTSAVGPDGSCSVSFLFEPDSWLKLLLRGLVSTLLEHEPWRAPALRITSPGQPREHARAILGRRLEHLRDLLARLSVDELLERAYESHLSNVGDEPGRFRLDPDANVDLAWHPDGGWRLALRHDPTADLEISDALVPACQWVLASESIPFSAATLLLSTSRAPHQVPSEYADRVSALLSALEALGVVKRT